MNLNIKYVKKELINPLSEVKNNLLIINLPNKYYIEQEEKKLNIAKKSFNDIMINKQYNAFHNFLKQLNG